MIENIPTDPNIAVFTAESIRAMGPVAQGIAKLLHENGRIVIEPSPGAKV